MIGYTRDLLYNLGAFGAPLFKRDIQTCFVNLAQADFAFLSFIRFSL